MNKEKEQERPEEEQAEQNWKREVMEWIIPLICAALFAGLVNLFLMINAVIPSPSMEDTIMTGDRIIGNRLAYLKDSPQRGDIVIFRYPDNEKKIYIKRVIGLPGETVEIKGGLVYLNDSPQPLAEPYLREIPSGDFARIQIPEGAYFMMGDNRNRSEDSRYWKNTFVYRNKILAKAAFKYWPKLQVIQ